MNKSKAGCTYSGCNYDALEKSEKGYCIFHAPAEEKDEKEFKDALRNYINGIDSKGRDHYFGGFVFVGDIDFPKDFQVIVFTKANFTGARFKGEANFTGAQFKGRTYFGGTRFKGEANFWRAHFKGEANFWQAHFKGEAYFGEAHFKGEANFWRARFKGQAYFGEAQFKGMAYFSEAQFKGRTYFEEAQFEEGLRLSAMYIKEYASFRGAILENSTLTPLNLNRKAAVDFTDARLRNTQMKREDIDDHILQERNKHFFEAKEIYLLLKNNFHSLGRYDDESWAFIKKKDMERKSFWHFRKDHKTRELGKDLGTKGIKDCFYSLWLDYEYSVLYVDELIRGRFESCGFWVAMRKFNRFSHYAIGFLRNPRDRLNKFVGFLELKRRKIEVVRRRDLLRLLSFYVRYSVGHCAPIKYLWSTFLKYLYGWGERPWLIFIWCFVTIFICSLLYYFWGTVITDSGIAITPYLKKLYFSGITFTALGYGDYSPIGWARILAFFESFLGVFFIALFVFSFARRTGGR